MSDRLRQTGRFIYLLALFQLAGGPLVIGGVMLVGRLFLAERMPMAESARLGGDESRGSVMEELVSDLAQISFADLKAVNSAQPQKPAPPQQAKDGKGKLWTANNLSGPVRIAVALPLIACLPVESEWLVTRSHPPPIPPPRAA